MTPENDGMAVGELNIEQSRKPDVFISYSSKNADVANQVVAHLEQHGIQCWIAPRNIEPGKEWVPAIQEALREAKVFVLIYTEESNASRQVMNEVALAFNAEKISVPLCLTDEEMNDELKYYLTRVHWLNAVSVPMEESLNELLKYVERGLGRSDAAETSFEGKFIPKDLAGKSLKNPAQSTELRGREEPSTHANVGEGRKAGKKKGKLALWIGIVAAAFLCVCLGCFAFFNHKHGGKNPDDLMEAGLEAFYYGNRGTEDAEKARAYFEEAAEKGIADAYYYLGQLKEWDYDYKAAKEYYEEGLEADSDLCRLGLGYLYQRGDGIGANYEKAWDLYCEAAEHDFAEADYYRGRYVEAGLSGEEINVYEAIKYYQNVIKNAENEYFVANAHNQLGLIYKRNRSDFPKDYDAALAEFEKVQDEEGMPWFYVTKLYNLGQTYQDMRKVESEEYFTQFFYAIQEMAEAGNAYAMYWCGFCFRSGTGTKKDPEAAKEWFLKADAAVKEKNPKACCHEAIYNLALLYANGEIGEEKDYETALEYFKEAANAGYGKAANAIGDLYLNGCVGKAEDGKPDLEYARQWYEKAIKYGDTSAYCNIGFICEKADPPDHEEAQKWFKLGAAAGSARSMFNLGIRFQDEEDYETAFSWYQKAADLGDENGCYMVARYYENGIIVEQSDEKAFQWYQIAADDGDVESIEIVVRTYFLGELSQKVNYEEALRYALKGAEKGSAICLYYCGMIYNKGDGVEKDQALAAQYFLKAANKGDVDSMREYGDLLLTGGRGVDVNVEEAIYWLEKAHEKGDLSALASLAGYYYDKEVYDKAFPCVLEFCQYELETGDPYLFLAEMYLYELGTEYNEKEAAIWLEKAYEKGAKLDYLEAYFLGVAYFYGNNVKQDYDKAFLLFQAAANESHDSDACMMLGLCYYAGVGVDEDDHEALKWLGSAIDGGGLDEESEEWCRSAIQNMVKNGAVSAEEAGKWLE